MRHETEKLNLRHHSYRAECWWIVLHCMLSIPINRYPNSSNMPHLYFPAPNTSINPAREATAVPTWSATERHCRRSKLTSSLSNTVSAFLSLLSNVISANCSFPTWRDWMAWNRQPYFRLIPLSISGTFSIVSCMMYRTIVTDRLCPNLTALPMAWASTAGFHCGSTRWTRVAAVRLSLECQSIFECLWEGLKADYPTAPVPVVINKTLVAGSSWNCLTKPARSILDTSPSIRTYLILHPSSIGSRTSKVAFQHENTMLSMLTSGMLASGA